MIEPLADPQPVPTPEKGAPIGVLLTRDLIFTSKVAGTARELGYHVAVVGDPAQALLIIEQSQPRVVFVDLAAGDLADAEALMKYKRLAGSNTAIIAFGSHVDTEALARARAAGCTEVMPRSKFSANLPELIRTHLRTDSPPAHP
jgi:CheY-like chemotaxis protein